MSSEDPQLRELLHRVANLLAVVQTQSAVARSEGTPESAQRALELIEESARRTEEELRRFRRGSS